MNIPILHPAPGLPPRRAFNVEDIRRMIEAGVLREDERMELIEGEIVMMSAKSIAHDNIKNALLIAFARAVPDGLYVAVECTLQLAEDILVEPDIAIISREVYKADPKSFARPRPEHVHLFVEIAVSSMNYDREVKARLYARHGIREYWVIDGNERRTFVHTSPTADGWSSIVERGPDEVLTTPAVPSFKLKLSDIP
jgi:Uma2 family endonuclease